MNLLYRIVDCFFPHFCVCCGSIGTDLCLNCLSKIKPRIVAQCVYCYDYVENGKTHKNCLKKYGIDGVWILFPYAPLLRTIIHAVKYRNVRGAMRDLIISKGQTRLAYQCRQIFPQDAILIPIPLFSSRHRSRGFNQAAYIADVFGHLFKLNVDETILLRKKDTTAQSAIKEKGARFENIKGAFEINTKQKIRTIVLVDDVWTTGATMLEACKVLKQSGVIQVFALILSGKIQPSA
ncbi:hypothetical protein A2690_00555 [Candidatus Roizmanbacteria bacterium RIFCSPHIGHO2_01_FULL_39_12b]|uniref:Phosphoribosyltransferase domain-containing protein n=1 Tax=Candidatus Roizmanbacteria bacterium RIFCSPHIGHO2_01_FULL_39_12b TaxID=1802030 RepID=A0A1F7G8I6_9BACT|nr:MAG: hypothetical protein A2690_00555 [Candidatus Roizmanbacteria bacterium RIFCSPHIGHO2_01_FULL_39_12b]OGK46051.1 MAG: hypothetical protein A3B46_00845 [Candidatus Roizmanbacteria bacterium RIFCSPLOWO2_01_FULL_39_19]